MHEPVCYIDQTRQLYDGLGYPPYQWFHADQPPAFAMPRKTLAASRLGLISTAGTYVHGQVAFHYKDDTSIRQIASCTPVADVRFSHVTENYLVEARQDPCAVIPLQALRQLADEGVVGQLAANYYSCMGGIYSQRRVREELVPALETAVATEVIDLLLLIPL